MTDALDLVYRTIEDEHRDESACSRRKLLAGASAALGSMGILSVAPKIAEAGGRGAGNNPQNIAAIAATAEVLATIVNTVGAERVEFSDAVTRRNVQAAARHEVIHYDTLVSPVIGARPLTKRIWVPNAVFSSEENLLRTLVTGDQIFVNAYLIATTVFGNAGNGKFARIAAEFMGVESVHRSAALQSLGRLGNDRAYALFQFTSINTAVQLLKGAGFGFGERGSRPGRFYDFDQVRRRTPNPRGVNSRSPR
jgi:hypothetical protein